MCLGIGIGWDGGEVPQRAWGGWKPGGGEVGREGCGAVEGDKGRAWTVRRGGAWGWWVPGAGVTDGLIVLAGVMGAGGIQYMEKDED